MDYSKSSLSLNDRLLEVYQLAAEECFPGVVVQERSGELRIKSLIRLPVEGDLRQFTNQQYFRIPEESLATISVNDYVMFSCDIPLHPHLNKRTVPFAEELTKVDKSKALQVKSEIHRKLNEHINSERLSEHRRQLETQAQEREKRLAEQEQELRQRAINLRSREETLSQREQDIKQKELRYELLSQDDRSTEANSVALPGSAIQGLFTLWPELLKSVGHISSSNYMAEQSLLLGLLCALVTGELVILDGPVGVGKTSVATRAAQVLAGSVDAFNLIPVRPGWIDSSDLLGFYNPSHKEYHPSPLLSVLDRAKNLDRRLCLICLDELNLARIENYGADLLSCIEERKDRKLPLYSQDIVRSLKLELGLLNRENGNLTHDGLLRKERIAQTLENFPAQFRIPDNVILIGTLNSDETTYDISPKVIDRAFVIRLPVADISTRSSVEDNSDPKMCILDLWDFRQAVATNQQENVDFPWLLEQVAQLQSSLSQLGIPLGYRIRRDLEILAVISRTVGLDNREVILQHFLFSKILPRVRCQKNKQTDLAWQEFRTALDAALKHDSTGVVQNLQRQWDDTTYYTVRYFDVVQ